MPKKTDPSIQTLDGQSISFFLRCGSITQFSSLGSDTMVECFVVSRLLN